MNTNYVAPMLCAVMLLTPTFIHADTIVFEDFEDSTLTYTPNLADAFDDIASSDYYGRLASDTVSAPAAVVLSNLQGTGYYGAMDTDSALGGGGPTPGIDLLELNWSVNTSSYENLVLSWFIAEDDDGSAQDWDSDTNFNVAIQLDGAGGFATIFAVESEENPGSPGDFTNEAPRVDTDFDGIGDGTEITDAFTQFSSSIANAGTVDIRVQFIGLNAGDEDFALDSVHLEGDFTGVPEPGSATFLAAAMVGTFFRRRRV